MKWLCLAVLWMGLASGCWAEKVVVAVAANFSAPMKVLAERFSAGSGHKLVVSYGSSGKFYAQIRQGAPFEVFLSADQDKPLRLEGDGLTVADSRRTYALGSLVLWSADPDAVDGSPAALQQNRYRKLALANSRLAPYGAAALEVLDALGVRAQAEKKLIRGDNISQAYQFVSSGNVELGFLALSQVWVDGALSHGSGWQVPTEMHAPIRQDLVLLKRGAENPAALDLLDFMGSAEAQGIIRAYGYGVAP